MRQGSSSKPLSPDVSADVLIRFVRQASEAKASSDILPALADALVEHAGASAVALLIVGESGGARFFPSTHLPTELAASDFDADDAISDLSGRVQLEACNGRFQEAFSRPLICGGDLFGSVTLFFDGRAPAARLELAEGLIDLAGIELGQAAKIQEIARSHAELKASHEALAKTEKLRALGEMAAGVSHDLKNILYPLSLHLQLVARAADRGNVDGVKEGAAEMKQVLARGVQTIERLRDYARQSPESRAEQLDLNKLVREAAEIAKPRMAARGGTMNKLNHQLGEPPLVMGRSGDVVSALVNLIVNAIDVMPGGGTITFRSGAADGGSFVEVADEGPGMTPEVQSRVFQPFFTTKGENGTGLGLAMVYACMQRHGGRVTLESAVGVGTTFRLWFPRSPGSS